MKNRSLAGLILTVIVLSALVGAVGGYYSATAMEEQYKPPPDSREPDQDHKPQEPDRDLPDDRDERVAYSTVKSSFITVNLVISLILIAMFVDLYRKIKTAFTLGLVLVMAAFFLYTLMELPMVPGAFGFTPFGLGPFLLIPHIFTTAALSILLIINLKAGGEEEGTEDLQKGSGRRPSSRSESSAGKRAGR
jgi:hypothetical protein